MRNVDFKEFEQLLLSAKNGDSEAKKKIIDNYKNFIYNQAFKYKILSYDLEDIISHASITVLKCIQSYDFNKNSNFTSYVTRAISNNLLDLAQKDIKKNGLNTTEDKLIYVKSEFELETDILLGLEVKQLHQALKVLTIEDLHLVSAIYYEKRSIREISKEMGISYATVFNRRKAILKQLLKELQK